MVERAMGLLDDAIREHLELKRQHGADPEEVARQERAALAPPETQEPLEVEPPSDDDEPVLAEGDSLGGEESPHLASPSAIQETAEIDMRTVLGGIDSEDEELRELSDRDRDARASSVSPPAARIEQSSSTPGIESDSHDRDAPAPRGRLFKRRRERTRASEGELPTGGSLP
jgi:hypothetical protein